MMMIIVVVVDDSACSDSIVSLIIDHPYGTHDMEKEDDNPDVLVVLFSTATVVTPYSSRPGRLVARTEEQGNGYAIHALS